MAEECMEHANDYSGLLLLNTARDATEIVIILGQFGCQH
jgi:hypothetical protein